MKIYIRNLIIWMIIANLILFIAGLLVTHQDTKEDQDVGEEETMTRIDAPISVEYRDTANTEMKDAQLTEENLSITIPAILMNAPESTEESVVELLEDFDQEDINYIAKTLYGECRGISSDMEKAAVAWCILNRVDAGYGDSIAEVVTAPYQFLGYSPDNPLLDELVEIAKDVISRWNAEKSGHTEVGRILPPEYLWFIGDGQHNHFRDEYKGKSFWDWSLENPYED